MTNRTDSLAVPGELQQLITDVRSVVQRGLLVADTVDAVATHLARYLAERHPLPERYRRTDPDHYVQHLIHTEPDSSFSIVALVWLPGQRTQIHDHVSWCVTGVAEGEEHEQRYTVRDGNDAQLYLVPTDQATNPVGDVATLTPPGDIHQVTNSADSLTVSLHIYGADIATLGSSVRRTYHLPVRSA